MMRLPKMEYVTPDTLEEACGILEKEGGGARILAGGTDLLVACKLRNLNPALIVSLRCIQDLKGISFEVGHGLRIGAMTPLADIRNDAAILRHYPALAQAAASVGAIQLQHMGTLGGNLCLDTRCIYYNQSESWRKSRPACFKMGGQVCHVVPKGGSCYAVFSGDMAPALIAHDALARLVSKSGERVVPVEELYTGDGKRPIGLNPGEILSNVMIKPPDGANSIYLKYRVRPAIDFPLAGVAVRLKTGKKRVCEDCSIVLTAVGPSPNEAAEAGDLLKGKPIGDGLVYQAAEKAAGSAYPVANVAGSTPSYRRRMVEILTRRALIALSKDHSVS
ncbi:MAG: FAD binding domain-containing protein [Deltaproteobacteria bacterium]|nr:FAD binding domain-containing protein [Deltaproteobacteria bacterium]